ncbi:MAG: hypothetical protein HY422_02635, partial [Candidatus Komeilibacteria bacterium]|nr:hypothetical protein [Candidatus Komeilibacteria bacterium]
MGDLIRTPHSEVTATLELLDRLGVTQHDFTVLRKSPSWSQGIVGRIHKTDPFLWAMLEMEQTAEKVGFFPGDFRELAQDEEKMRQVLAVVRGVVEIKAIERFSTWRTIKLGTHKNVKALKSAITDAGFHISDWANDILGKRA